MKEHDLDAQNPAVSSSDRLRQTTNDRERDCDMMVDALGDLIGLKSYELKLHCQRVTAFTIALARSMGVFGERFRAMARGAFLHDIGIIGVPDAILFKHGPLNAGEIELLRQHCLRGYHIVKKIPLLADSAEIVYAHEEWHDGTGYPRGLSGDDIPLGARIFSVAHALDAMTAERRVYRQSRSMAAAREEIAGLAGRQFDPKVVSAFLQMPEVLWENLRREVDSLSERYSAHMS